MPEGTKLTRDKIREIVSREAHFSEKWERQRKPGEPGDADKATIEWLALMNTYVQEAMKAATLGKDKVALHNLRCILNLGEACAMYRGLPEREEGDNTDLYMAV